MDINWIVRIKNKAWWLAIIPALALLINSILQIFGITWDYSDLIGKIAAVVEAVFAFLALLGVNVDPSTNDWSDSARALTYTKPAPNVKEQPVVAAAHLGGEDSE